MTDETKKDGILSDVSDAVDSVVEEVSETLDAAADHAAEGAKDIVEEVDQAVDAAADEISEAADDVKSDVSEVVDDAKSEVSEVVDDISDDISEAKEEISEALSDDSDASESDASGEVAVKETEELERGDWETIESDRETEEDESVKGIAAFFDHPDHLMYAAEQARDAEFEKFDAYSPFPIHGMDEAMGLGRSWIPWVTFLAGATGFSIAVSLQFGIMTLEWPMVFGGKPFMSWPSFVPIMFELTVLLGGVTTAVVMLIAAGCFRKPFIIDRNITNDRFVLWISADDKSFNADSVVAFMKELNPSEIRTVRESAA